MGLDCRPLDAALIKGNVILLLEHIPLNAISRKAGKDLKKERICNISVAKLVNLVYMPEAAFTEVHQWEIIWRVDLGQSLCLQTGCIMYNIYA